MNIYIYSASKARRYGIMIYSHFLYSLHMASILHMHSICFTFSKDLYGVMMIKVVIVCQTYMTSTLD